MTLDPHFKAMLDAQTAAAAAAAPTPPLTQIPPDMVRAGYRAQRTSQNVATTVASVAARDLEVGGAAGTRPARLYTPAEAATPSGLLVYFHGGGFVIGDLETHDAHCRRLAHVLGPAGAGGGLSPGAGESVSRPATTMRWRRPELGVRPRRRAGRRPGADRGRRRLRPAATSPPRWRRTCAAIRPGG